MGRERDERVAAIRTALSDASGADWRITTSYVDRADWDNRDTRLNAVCRQALLGLHLIWDEPAVRESDGAQVQWLFFAERVN